MEFPDLHEFSPGHPPSPYEKPVSVVKVGSGMLSKGLRLRAVGWIERPGFPIGKVPKEFVDAVVGALGRAPFHDGYRGIHPCMLCGEEFIEVRWRRKKIALTGYGHYLVRSGRIVYMAPSLLLHYVLDHSYRPPHQFIKAAMTGVFLTVDDLVVRWGVDDDE
jgi:hypothetical protein